MADFCTECTVQTWGEVTEGTHDLPEGRRWCLCEGCGWHLFEDGVRACGTADIDEETGLSTKLTFELCQDCVAVA